MPVVRGVVLAGFRCVVRSVTQVTLRGVGMMGSLFVIACLVVLGGLMMMLRGIL